MRNEWLPLRVIDYVESAICEERSNLGEGFEVGGMMNVECRMQNAECRIFKSLNFESLNFK